MTIVNHTSGTHTGLLVTGTGDDLEIDLEIVGGRTLRMSAAGDELGAWPIEECHIAPDPARDGSFRLVVDGEDARFTPSDPTAFTTLIHTVMGGSLRAEHESETLAASPDDPVAFLFGSAPPPTPLSTDLGEVHQVDGHDGHDAPDVADAMGDTVPDDGAVPETFQPVASDETDRVEMPTEIPTADDVGEPEPVEPELQDDRSPALTEPRFEADDLDTGFVSFPDVDVSEPETGSALGRLSAAIGSLRSPASSDASGDHEEIDDPDAEYVIGPNTVATDVLETQRTLRQHQLREMTKGKWLKWGGITVAVVAVVALFSFLTPRAIDFLQNYRSDTPSPSTTVATTVETTVAEVTSTTVETTGTTAPTVLPADGEGGTIFDRPSPEFVAAWESAGGAIDEVLLFDRLPQLGPFSEQFTPFVRMEGIVQPDGTLDGFTLVIDPSGPAEYDRIGIQALGVAIATVDPERSPQGRASLLAELGLNVRQPLLEGIDGATEAAGIAYTLVYDAAANLLTMTVAPAG